MTFSILFNSKRLRHVLSQLSVGAFDMADYWELEWESVRTLQCWGKCDTIQDYFNWNLKVWTIWCSIINSSLLGNFNLNRHTLGFRPQIQKMVKTGVLPYQTNKHRFLTTVILFPGGGLWSQAWVWKNERSMRCLWWKWRFVYYYEV